jgi:hypothetical protein
MNQLILKNILKTFDKKKERNPEGPVQLGDFELKDIIGQGAFGKVRDLDPGSSNRASIDKASLCPEVYEQGGMYQIGDFAQHFP